MRWANCSRCGRAYGAVPGGRDICQACMKEEDDNYLKIFHFMSTRPAATAQEIAQETGIDLKEILRYVRENRLRLVKADTGLSCESCGIPIAQGKMCDKCMKKLAEEFKTDLEQVRKNAPKTDPSRKDPPSRDPKYLKDRRN